MKNVCYKVFCAKTVSNKVEAFTGLSNRAQNLMVGGDVPFYLKF